MNDNEKKERGRGTTRSGQEGLKHPHLAGGEDGALYIIKHIVRHDISPRFPYRLYLRRQNGYKFKKSFRTLEEAQWYLDAYLRLCCQVCKHTGIAQKVSDIGGIRDGISNFPRDHISKPSYSRFHPDGKSGHCQICKAEYQVYYEGHIKRLRSVEGHDGG